MKGEKITGLQNKNPSTQNKPVSLLGIMVVILLVMLSSCVKKPVAESRYVSIDSVLQAQKNILAASHTLLSREVQLDGKIVRDSIINLDSVGWATELDEFSRLSAINKPTYKGTFAIEDGLRDAKSNLKVKAFINTKGLPIKYLKLYYQEHPFKLRKIESMYAEGDKNALYKNSRLLVLEFHDVYNKTMLSSYSITGGQKIFAGDTIEFAIQGKITID